MILKNTEYILGGHPDRLTDAIAETIALSIYNLDGWDGRSAVEALYVGNRFVLGGEFNTSLNDKDFTKLCNWIIKKILSKQTNEKIEITHIWQKQSSEIHKASQSGWGDNTIAYGYCSKDGRNITPNHARLKNLASKITSLHTKELPDGKLISFGGNDTISIEQGISEGQLAKLGVKRPTIFEKSGASADSGTVGRKLVAERHGNGIPHGGGAFTGKDFTKGDKTLKLIGDDIAKKIQANVNHDVLVQISTKYGDEKFYIEQIEENDYDISKIKIKTMLDYKGDINALYEKYAPVKPSHYLNVQDLKDLEKLLLKISGKQKLQNTLW